MKRLGIYGGTFSPPHLGHINAARRFIKEARLDALYVIPTANPPHKVKTSQDSEADRLKMLEYAFSGMEGVTVSDMEMQRGGVSYTYQTLSALACEDVQLIMLVGTDMLLTLDSWKRPDIIFSLAEIFAVARDDGDIVRLLDKARQYREKFGARVTVSQGEVFDISSSEIREMLATGKDASSYLTPNVLSYINERKLYGAGFDGALSRLCEKRRRHSVGVAECAVEMAEALGLDTVRCYRAGILHDIAKELPCEEMIRIATEGGYTLSQDDLTAKEVLHQYAGAVIAREEFGLDSAACGMIAKHCTGAEVMTLEEKVLFLADFIEKGRSHSMCRQLREEFFSEEITEKRVSEFAKRAAECTVGYLEKEGRFIHRATKIMAFMP